MSKYDNAIEFKKKAAQLIHAINCSQGLDRRDNDKHSCYFGPESAIKCDSNNWDNASLFLHMSYGYYGSSSGHSANSSEVAAYIVKAANKLMHQICETAKELIKKDLEKIQQEAKEEAEFVLKELKEKNWREE